MVQRSINAGYTDCDFSILLQEQAKVSGLELEPGDADVGTGL